MMDDLKVLKELIKRQAFVPLGNTAYGKKTVALTENVEHGVSRSQYSIEIKGVPNESVVIKTDLFPAPKQVFNCRSGECRRADYVIISNSSNGSYIVYIEIKKKHDALSHIKDQLRGSMCFMAYCRELGREFWGKSDFLGSRYRTRFVTIRLIGFNKQMPQKLSDGLHDKPERVLKIVGKTSLHFRELIYGKKR